MQIDWRLSMTTCCNGCACRLNALTAGYFESTRSSAISLNSRSSVFHRVGTSHFFHESGSGRCRTHFRGSFCRPTFANCTIQQRAAKTQSLYVKMCQFLPVTSTSFRRETFVSNAPYPKRVTAARRKYSTLFITTSGQ